MTGVPPDTKLILQAELMKKALTELPQDLQTLVAFSGVSLNPVHVQKTLSVMVQVLQVRSELDKQKTGLVPLSEHEKKALDTVHKMLYESYKDLKPTYN